MLENRSEENALIKPEVSKRKLSSPDPRRLVELNFVLVVLGLVCIVGLILSGFLFASGWKTGTFPQVGEYIQLWKELFQPIILLVVGYACGRKS